MNNDETFSEVRFASLNPTVAYSFNDNLSIGLSAILGYSDVQFRFWPGASTNGGTPPPETSDDFYGMDLSEPAKNLQLRLPPGPDVARDSPVAVRLRLPEQD